MTHCNRLKKYWQFCGILGFPSRIPGVTSHTILHLIIPHIRLHTVYYETRYLFSITKSWIYDKEKREQVKVIISYKSAMDLNTFLFDTTGSKIGHSWVGQDQVVSTYLQAVSQLVLHVRAKKLYQTSIFNLTVPKIM